MKKRWQFIVVMVFMSLALSLPAMAHSGRTDAQGGHRDNKNVSGLGSYHYHCGGNPAHLHKNGICPYSTTVVVKQPTQKQTAKAKEITSYTDIRVFINGYEIPAFHYQDNSYILAEDLSNFGFDVTWEENTRELKIVRNIEKTITALSNADTTRQYDIENTDIQTIGINGSDTQQLKSYNIGGQTIVKFDDLEIFGTVNWDGINRVTTLTLK